MFHSLPLLLSIDIVDMFLSSSLLMLTNVGIDNRIGVEGTKAIAATLVQLVHLNIAGECLSMFVSLVIRFELQWLHMCS